MNKNQKLQAIESEINTYYRRDIRNFFSADDTIRLILKIIKGEYG